jgi:hypothetical protein
MPVIIESNTYYHIFDSNTCIKNILKISVKFLSDI